MNKNGNTNNHCTTNYNINGNDSNNANDSINVSNITTNTNSYANAANANVSHTKATSTYADNDFNNRRVITIADKNSNFKGTNKKFNICFTNKSITHNDSN